MAAIALVRSSDRELQALLKLSLQGSDWELISATSIDDFAEAFRLTPPDVVVVDLDQEGGDAMLTVASRSPAFVAAVCTDPGDEKATGALARGADAVFVKPLSPDLLLSRLDAALRYRRKQIQPGAHRYVFDNLEIDEREYAVTVNGKLLHLSSTEHKLLRILAEHAGRILTHDQLLREVWGGGYEGNHDLLRTFVSNLRSRLQDAGVRQELIKTERMLGYWMLRPPERTLASGPVELHHQDMERSLNESIELRAQLRGTIQELKSAVSRLRDNRDQARFGADAAKKPRNDG
jgi:two-component system KDP operon response regulator KdpE